MVLLVKTIRGNVIYHEAPDGGWAWIVLGAGFFIMAILFSTVRCLGIFYNDFMDHYAATNSQTSWIFAIATSMLGIAAPVGSKLIRTFDSRKVLFLSGFLCCVGLVISVFATHLWIVYVGIGLVWGCGLSWSYVCLFTQVNIYFSRWRGLANGVVACGSATGAAFVPLGIQKLAVLLGWRGAMFIMAGLGLNICAFGALIRPISVASEAELSKHEEMAGANKTTNVELQMVAVSQGQEKSDSSKQVDGPDKVETESPAKKIRGFVKDYWLLALYGLTQFSVGICLFIPVMYIVPFSKDIGCTEDEAALLISMTAFGDVVFRPLVGAVISCVPFLEKNILYCLSALCLVQFALCVIPI